MLKGRSRRPPFGSIHVDGFGWRTEEINLLRRAGWRRKRVFGARSRQMYNILPGTRRRGDAIPAQTCRTDRPASALSVLVPRQHQQLWQNCAHTRLVELPFIGSYHISRAAQLRFSMGRSRAWRYVQLLQSRWIRDCWWFLHWSPACHQHRAQRGTRKEIANEDHASAASSLSDNPSRGPHYCRGGLCFRFGDSRTQRGRLGLRGRT